MHNEHQPARMARLALILVAAGLIANSLFNLAMARTGHIYPYTNFLYRPDDRWADFFKLVFAYPGDPIHAPARQWPFYELIDYLKEEADAMRGTKINPDHLPPLPTLLALLARRAFSLIDPVIVFMACAAAGFLAFASSITGWAKDQFDRLVWLSIALLSYPVWFIADRGHFFSLICAIAVINAVRRMIETRQMDWRSIVMLAIACNLRPNVVIIPVMLVLAGRMGRFRDLVWLGLCGAVILILSMAAAHLLYPHYGPAAWLAGLADYNRHYVQSANTLGFMTSVPSMLTHLLGHASVWSIVGMALAAICGLLTIALARAAALGTGQLVFLSLGLMVIAIPGFADYHLVPFLLPVFIIGSQTTQPTRGDWIAFLTSVFLLVPKNYVYGADYPIDAWSYQVLFNPMVLLVAVIAVLVIAIRRQPGAISQQWAELRSAARV